METGLAADSRKHGEDGMATEGSAADARRRFLGGTGAPWRDLPERFGSCKTVHRYFSNWRAGGVFAAIIEALQVKLDAKGLIDWELWCVDGAIVRATRAAAGAGKKVARGTPTNRRTTHWAARAAGLDRNSTWSLTVRELHLPSK